MSQRRALSRCFLRVSQLSGAIPEKLFEGLTSLQKVRLGANKLSAAIPESLLGYQVDRLAYSANI
jgi:hypothetical protein